MLSHVAGLNPDQDTISELQWDYVIICILRAVSQSHAQIGDTDLANQM